MSLIKIEFPAHLGEVIGVNIGGIHLTLKKTHHLAVMVAVLTIQDDFTARGAEVARHRGNRVGFTFVDVGDVACVVDQFLRAAAWTFRGYGSLKETINTPSMTVNQ